MKKLNCKLIVSDFDGTLANSKNEVDRENVEAINTYIADGGIFAVCTGRTLPSILPRVRELGLKGLVVACQGAVIADVQSGEIIHDERIPYADAAAVCERLEELSANINAYDEYGFMTTIPEDDKHLAIYEEITRIKGRHPALPLSEHIRKNKIDCHKLATLCWPEEQPELFQKLKNTFGDKFDVTCSATVLIEISPMGETKGEAIKFLAGHYGVPMQETCAIGDNLNDLSMIEAAAYGIAVGNAAEGLKIKADAVTVDNDSYAVKKVIEEYGYCHD